MKSWVLLFFPKLKTIFRLLVEYFREKQVKKTNLVVFLFKYVIYGYTPVYKFIKQYHLTQGRS